MVARDKRKGGWGTMRDCAGWVPQHAPSGVVIRAKAWASKDAGVRCDGQVPTWLSSIAAQRDAPGGKR